MTETPGYKQELYVLQTLDKRGGMFLHTIDKGDSRMLSVTDATGRCVTA
jgi:hypothetical protein